MESTIETETRQQRMHREGLQSQLAACELAIKFIDRNCLTRQGCTLKRIAQAVGYSEFHFHRVFRKHCETTPKAFVVQRQIAEVRRRLLAGDEIKDIARGTGFVSQSHLGTAFRQHVGVSPSKWLRAQKAKVPS